MFEGHSQRFSCRSAILGFSDKKTQDQSKRRSRKTSAGLVVLQLWKKIKPRRRFWKLGKKLEDLGQPKQTEQRHLYWSILVKNKEIFYRPFVGYLELALPRIIEDINHMGSPRDTFQWLWIETLRKYSFQRKKSPEMETTISCIWNSARRFPNFNGVNTHRNIKRLCIGLAIWHGHR